MKSAVDMKFGQIGKHAGAFVMRSQQGLVRLEAPFDTLVWYQDSFAPVVEILEGARLVIETIESI